MSGSILLPFTGSQESLYASELAWALAERTNSLVNAQHVIDTRGAFEFIGLEKPGLIGSGPYLAAYEKACEGLREVGEKLEDAYQSRVDARKVSGEVFLDEGDPIEEICNRLRQHSLAIVGHRQRSMFSWPECQTVKLSLAEILAHHALAPVLIVQKRVHEFSEMALFTSMDHLNVRWINNCIASAQAIGATCSLTLLASAEHEEPPIDFARDLKKANPELKDVPIRLATRSNAQADICSPHLRGALGQEGVLAVVATVDAGEHRITSSGECPRSLLRRLSFDAVLIWPEECDKPLFSSEVVAKAS